MIIKSANFIGSYPRMDMCPPSQLPEFAFIGRSNVGKSTLINLLTNRNKLAKVSSTPGKTQLLNFFLINEQWHLVDLPGYGYAKSSKENRSAWGTMIRKYLTGRENVQCIFVLIDSRLPPQKVDLDFINWLGQEGLPWVLVFTKADKSSNKEVQHNVTVFKNKLLETWEAIPQDFITSSVTRTGHEAILSFISEVIAKYEPPALEESNEEDFVD
jgi:GTP-binding protein